MAARIRVSFTPWENLCEFCGGPIRLSGTVPWKFYLVISNLINFFFFKFDFFSFQFVPVTENEIAALQVRLEEVLKKLRPDAVAITDGFEFHDKVLNSALGSYDGNVYERLFEAALKHPLNKKPVPDFFGKYLKPFMKENAMKSKL